jgi:hypothetical protein
MLATALGMMIAEALAWDDAKYIDLKGQWTRTIGGAGRYDPTKPLGRLQEAPLTPEYQAIHEASLADQAQGGQGDDPTYRCLSPGMPRIMHAYSPMEVVVTPETTHILIEHILDNRRIHTDGRDWPADMDLNPMFAGYSIGRWIDAKGSGPQASACWANSRVARTGRRPFVEVDNKVAGLDNRLGVARTRRG